MNKADYYFKENLKKILSEDNFDENPRPKYKDGTPAHSMFITQVFEEYDISKGEYPITTLRNTAIKTGIKEIQWIYQDQNSDLKSAHKRGIKWWDEWDIGDGTIGFRYGYTIAKYDLMNSLLNSLKNDPFSRRHIMDMYQYADLNGSPGLHPCAFKTIWAVRKKNGIYYIDMTLDQRSSDYIMANYINKTQYLALMLMVCSHTGYKPGKFCHYVHNLHIYDRHYDAVKEILEREPIDINPKLELVVSKNFYEIEIDDFIITDINEIPKIESELEIAI